MKYFLSSSFPPDLFVKFFLFFDRLVPQTRTQAMTGDKT
jgi:hypothetical protein